MRRKYFSASQTLWLSVEISLVLAPAADAQEVLRKSFAVEGGLMAVTIKDRAECQDPLVSISGPSAAFFSGDQKVFKANLAAIGAYVTEVCPNIAAMRIEGTARQQLVYQGRLKRDGDWSLEAAFSPLERTLAELAVIPVDQASLEMIATLLASSEDTLGGRGSEDWKAFAREAGLKVGKIAEADLPSFETRLGQLGDTVDDIDRAEKLLGEYDQKYSLADESSKGLYRLALDNKLTTIRDKAIAEFETSLKSAGSALESRLASIDLAEREAKAKQDKIPQFADIADRFVAAQIDALNAGASSFGQELSTLPQTWETIAALDKLAGEIETKQPRIPVLAEYAAKVAARKVEGIDALRTEALTRVPALGSGVDDVELVIDESDQLARRFAKAGHDDFADEVRLAAADRLDELVIDGYDNFMAELQALGPTQESLETLRSLTLQYQTLGEHIPAFLDYQDAAVTRATEIDKAICQEAQRPLESIDAKPLMVLADNQARSLPEFACDLYRREHRIESFEPIDGGDAYRMQLRLDEEEAVSVRLSQQSAEEGHPATLIGTAFLSDDGEEPISKEDWAALSSDWSRKVPSGIPGADGVTDCDRLAADPNDPKKVAAGVADEVLDPEGAAEACVVALEVDPENVRLLFQLGRALYAAGLIDEARPYLETASQGNYAAAHAYLGDILSLSGTAEELTVTFYEKAIKGGYVAAKERLTIPGEIDFQKSPPEAGQFKLTCFIQSEVFDAFGNFDGSADGEFLVSMNLDNWKAQFSFDSMIEFEGRPLLVRGKAYDLDMNAVYWGLLPENAGGTSENLMAPLKINRRTLELTLRQKVVTSEGLRGRMDTSGECMQDFR